MNLKSGVVVVVFLLALIVSGSPSLALDPIPQQSGFSGYIQPGLGYLNMKSNMVAKVVSFDLSDKRISDLDEEPDSESTAIFTLPFKIAYTFAGSRIPSAGVRTSRLELHDSSLLVYTIDVVWPGQQPT